jgi:hypothetical protein
VRIDGRPYVEVMVDRPDLVELSIPLLHSSLFCRNTEDTIRKEDYQVPSTVDNVRLLDFSEVRNAPVSSCWVTCIAGRVGHVCTSTTSGRRIGAAPAGVSPSAARGLRRCAPPILMAISCVLFLSQGKEYGSGSRSLEDVRRLRIRQNQAELNTRRIDYKRIVEEVKERQRTHDIEHVNKSKIDSCRAVLPFPSACFV